MNRMRRTKVRNKKNKKDDFEKGGIILLDKDKVEISNKKAVISLPINKREKDKKVMINEIAGHEMNMHEIIKLINTKPGIVRKEVMRQGRRKQVNPKLIRSVMIVASRKRMDRNLMEQESRDMDKAIMNLSKYIDK